MRTLEQQRAAHALSRVRELKHREPALAFLDKYRSYVDRLGPAIIMNGLGQALATEKASGEMAHTTLYNNVSGWLCRPGGVYSGAQDALEGIMDYPQAKYVRAQAEALAWLQWHKKFCRASFPKGKGD